MQHEDSILMVGCGNSKLSQQMYDAGYRHIVNVDISPSVIEQMKKVSPDMEWLVMDCTNMDFKDNSFDYVIDKGTMDALIAGRDLTPSYELLKECSRVTKEEGQLILITYGSPEGRKKVFEAALPFVEFDYFFTYINLNDMSTMINLMRNNLVGPNGEKVDKQEALQRSLK
jgi:EEF1A lysine methyltransferase 4